MKKTLESLPIIDWAEGKRLAGGNQGLAEDMLYTLIIGLPNDLIHLKQFYNVKAYPALTQLLHKLHGALCYCGTPRLKAVVADLERDLKNNIMDNVPEQFEQLELEVHLLLEHYSHKNE